MAPTRAGAAGGLLFPPDAICEDGRPVARKEEGAVRFSGSTVSVDDTQQWDSDDSSAAPPEKDDDTADDSSGDTPAEGGDSSELPSGDLDYVRLLPPKEFQAFLEEHGVPIKEYSRGQAKTVRDLWGEVVLRECELERFPDPSSPSGHGVRRHTTVVALEISACIGGEDKFLLLRDVTTNAGRHRRGLMTRVTKKMFADETLPEAVGRCCWQVLNLSEQTAKTHFIVRSTERIQEVKTSTGFPGIRTLYTFNIVRLHAKNSHAPELASLNLKSGREFRTSVAATMVAGSTRRWKWVPRGDLDDALEAASGYRVPVQFGQP